MRLSLDNILGIHQQALTLYSQRSSVLASNLANADTPGFKARDIDFRAALSQANSADAGAMKMTHKGHMNASGSHKSGPAELLYREPAQPSLDGNTVDNQIEQAAFSDNAMHYMATLDFQGGRVKGIIGAIRGE